MSLTSYQTAPPRALKILGTLILCKSKNRWNRLKLVFRSIVTSLTCERTNSCRHSQLVGPRFCGALVSEEIAGWRAAALVCAAFRIGRGKLDVLFRARAANGGALVCCDAGRFHIRREA